MKMVEIGFICGLSVLFATLVRAQDVTPRDSVELLEVKNAAPGPGGGGGAAPATLPKFRKTLADLHAREQRAGDALIAAFRAARTDHDRHDLETMLKELVVHLQHSGAVSPWYKYEHFRMKSAPKKTDEGGLEAEITVEDPDHRPPKTDNPDKQWDDPRILIWVQPGKGWRAVVHAR